MKYRKILFLATICLFLVACEEKDKTVETGSMLDVRAEDSAIILQDLWWESKNLGASRVCTSFKGDKECWGDLYQWGRQADGHQKRDSMVVSDKSKTTEPQHEYFIAVKSNNLTQNANWTYVKDDSLWSHDGENSVCPIGFHVPNMEEYQRLNIKTCQDGFEKIKLSNAGSRFGVDKYQSGGLIIKDDSCYWTSSANGDKAVALQFLKIDEKDCRAVLAPLQKTTGCAVRCVKDK